jgi:hypothetical protein
MATTTHSTQDVITFGGWHTGPAWSTMKVPLAMAAMGYDASSPTLARARAAVQESDNTQAQSLWSSLGAGGAAASKVDAVLEAHQDRTTQTQPTVLRPGFSAIGQSQWSLANQVRFAAGLECDPEAQPVLAMMGSITPAQRWGLGRWPGARFKGGWGPDASGAYTVRQFGLLPTSRGTVVIAVAVTPDDGSFATGTRQLDRIATWLHANAHLLPLVDCKQQASVPQVNGR